MPITALYGSLLALIFMALTINEALRAGLRPGSRHGGAPGEVRLPGAHSSFAEYVPLALILVALAESMKAPPQFLHGLGVALLAARAMHAFGPERTRTAPRIRRMGATLTFLVIGFSALLCFGLGLFQTLI